MYRFFLILDTLTLTLDIDMSKQMFSLYVLRIFYCLLSNTYRLVIEQKWTCEQLKNYIEQTQHDHEVTGEGSSALILLSFFYLYDE